MTSSRKQASFPNTPDTDSTIEEKQRLSQEVDEHEDKLYRQDPTEFARVREKLVVIYPHLALPLSTTVDPRPKWPAWVDPSPVSSSTRSKSKAKALEAPIRPAFAIGRFDYETGECDSNEREFSVDALPLTFLETELCQR